MLNLYKFVQIGVKCYKNSEIVAMLQGRIQHIRGEDVRVAAIQMMSQGIIMTNKTMKTDNIWGKICVSLSIANSYNHRRRLRDIYKKVVQVNHYVILYLLIANCII